MNMEGITLYKPRFREINPRADGEFYVNMYGLLENFGGCEKDRYDSVKRRLDKFFLQ
jgi:hypothetical protein